MTKKVHELTELDMAMNRAESWVRSAHTYEDVTRLAALARASRDLDEALRLCVAEVRAAGGSWADVGGALGVSKQAASQRYGRPAGK